MIYLGIKEYLLVDEALRWVANYSDIVISKEAGEVRKNLRKRYEEMLSAIIEERSKNECEKDY